MNSTGLLQGLCPVAPITAARRRYCLPGVKPLTTRRVVEVVITGEGSLDGQSLGGKTPVGVARAARAAGVPRVIAVCGRTTLTTAQAATAGFDQVHALAALEPDPQRSMREAARLLTEVGAAIAASLEPHGGAARA